MNRKRNILTETLKILNPVKLFVTPVSENIGPIKKKINEISAVKEIKYIHVKVLSGKIQSINASLILEKDLSKKQFTDTHARIIQALEPFVTQTSHVNIDYN